MSEIKPALTPKEWAWLLCGEGEPGPTTVEQMLQTGNRHGTAALALYRQPFGFTREDVDLLRTVHRQLTEHNDHWPELLPLADRMEALLPPRDP